ncbi:MFS transporter [Modestobacter muralis]|uniref:MFS transporter n=1 Tax=Modestobacter muralis TaxID=1608614 RepID=UPI001B8D98F9
MPSTHPSYRAALMYPHILRSFLPSMLGRLSLAVSGLALVLHLQATTGSFTVSGAVTAAFGIANVVATPWRARAIDRFGQAWPLAGLGAVHAVTLAVLAGAPTDDRPVLVCLGVVAGLSAPPFGATMRVVWSQALPEGLLRTRGLSLDAVTEEIVFTAGPLAGAALIAVSDPLVALLASAGLTALGAGSYVTSPLSLRQRGHVPDAVGEVAEVIRPLRTPGFLPVVWALLAPGIILGAVEIAAPAIGVAAGSTVLAGALLAVFAGASALGGLLYGRLEWKLSPGRRLVILGAGLIGTTALSGLIGSTGVLVVGIGLMGAFIAPMLITGYLAADQLTDARVHTEASSWINTSVNLGAALGSGLYGLFLDEVTPGSSLVLCAVAAALVTAAGFFRLVKT